MKLFEKITIRRTLGLHLRTAAHLVKITREFQCRIKIQKGEIRVDARSLLDLLTLGAQTGSELALYFDGKDAAEASMAVRAFLEEEPGENFSGLGIFTGPAVPMSEVAHGE